MSDFPIFNDRSVFQVISSNVSTMKFSINLSPMILMAVDNCCLDPLFHQGLQNDNFLLFFLHLLIL